MLQEFVDALNFIPGIPVVVVGLIAIALGLLECFMGYRIFKVQVGIVAFLAGIAVGIQAMDAAVGILWLSIAVGILLGFVLCVLSLKIYKAGVFLVVGALAFIAVYMLSQSLWISLIAAVAAGLLGVFFTRHAIIIATAFGGACMLADGVSGLIWQSQAALPDWADWAGWGVIALLAAAGMIVQFRADRSGSKSGSRK